MIHLKTFGLSALAVVATLAFATGASATTVTTSTGGAAATPAIHAVSEGGHVTIQNPIGNISCASTIEGNVESHGSGVTAKGKIATLSFTGCTNSWHVTAVNNGSLEIHYTSGHNGVLTSSGMRIDTTRFGVTCVYETNNTYLGTVTGGNPATVHIEANIPLEAVNFLCGTGAHKFEGNYVTTSALYVAP